MTDCLQKEPKTKTRKLCEVAGVSKSSFYYNREINELKEEINKFQKNIVKLETELNDIKK